MIEPSLFTLRPYSDLFRQFVAKYEPHYRFNWQRGIVTLAFMIAHFMHENPQFQRLDRGLRSKVLTNASGVESTYSIWESNDFGPIYTRPGADLPKFAHKAALGRLVDALILTNGFDRAYAFFKSDLNPLAKFPTKLLYDVLMCDSKTLLQEFTQEFLRRLPEYDTKQIGGQQHEPVFGCTVQFAAYRFDGRATTKSLAEINAAAQAISFLLKERKREISLLLAKRLSVGMRQRRGRPLQNQNISGKLVYLRRAVGVTAPDTNLVKCLTLRADASRYGLQEAAINEDLSFCGSQLAMAWHHGRSVGTKRYPAIDAEVMAAVHFARRQIYPRTKDIVSNEAYQDMIQALLYAEFLHAGYESAQNLYSRCYRRRKNHDDVEDRYLADVNYPQILQEFTQGEGAGLPSYEYSEVNPSKPHSPVFKCRASFRGVWGEGLGSTKRNARHKAAYELLVKLRKVGISGRSAAG